MLISDTDQSNQDTPVQESEVASDLAAIARVLRRRSATVSSIVAALAKAQSAFENAGKDSENPHFHSRYADLASVINAVRLPLAQNGIARAHSIEYPPDGILIRSELMHGEEFLACDVMIPIDMSRAGAHAIGTAITYGRRYGLQAVCGVAAEDDDGNAATEAKPDTKPQTQHRAEPPKPPQAKAPAQNGSRLPPKCERCTKPIVGEDPTFNRERKPFHNACYEAAAAEFRAKQSQGVPQQELPASPPKTVDITDKFSAPEEKKPASVPPPPPPSAAAPANDNAEQPDIYELLKEPDANEPISDATSSGITVMLQSLRWNKLKVKQRYEKLFPEGPSLTEMRQGHAKVLLESLRREYTLAKSRGAEVANG